jgi:hypothetical protein
MGAGYCKIRFEENLPSFVKIQSAFHDLTGLKLSLIADLQLQQLSDSADEIFSQLEKDLDAVIEIEKLRKEYLYAQDYEWLAEYRDKINNQLSQLSYIQNVRFKIYGFYEIALALKVMKLNYIFLTRNTD